MIYLICMQKPEACRASAYISGKSQVPAYVITSMHRCIAICMSHFQQMLAQNLIVSLYFVIVMMFQVTILLLS